MDKPTQLVPPTSSGSASGQYTADNSSSNGRAAAAAAAQVSSAAAGTTSCSTSQSPNDTVKKETLRTEACEAACYLHNELSNCSEYAELMEPKKGIKDFNYKQSFSTLQNKANSGQYADIWDVLHDIYEMFGKVVPNHRIIVRTKTRTSKPFTELFKKFQEVADGYMKLRGYCCGLCHFYCVTILICHCCVACQINPGDTYYSYKDRIICEQCFKKKDYEIYFSDVLQQTARIPKKDLEKVKNNQNIIEPLVTCIYCGRRFHRRCMRHVDESEEFVCTKCLDEKKIVRKINNFRAAGLPLCKLARRLENRVKSNPKLSRVTIRVVCYCNGDTIVEENVRKQFLDMPDKFPMKRRAIFAFLDVNDVDLCLFGMFTEEYSAQCPPPNSLFVNLTYLDSVKIPDTLDKDTRTDLFHNIIIGYLEYIGSLGYKWCHIWSSPSEVNSHEYIFNCRPLDQKYPSKEQLLGWYLKLLNRAVGEGVVSAHMNASEYFSDRSHQSPLEIPYFGADPWYYQLQEAMEKKKEMNPTGVSSQSTTRTPGRAARVASTRATNGNPDTIFNRAYDAYMKESKYILYVQLKEQSTAQNNVNDFDTLFNCEFIESRESFLLECRKNRWEFCTERRALFSTMAFLHKVHQDIRKTIICAGCQCSFTESIKSSSKSSSDQDSQLCKVCHEKQSAEDSFGSDGGNTSSIDRSANSPRDCITSPKQKTDSVDILEHADRCVNTECTIKDCKKFKNLFEHHQTCNQNSGCSTCRELMTDISHHARCCNNNDCSVPCCDTMKIKHQQQMQQELSMRRQTTRSKVAAVQRSEEDLSSNTKSSSTIGADNYDDTSDSDIEDGEEMPAPLAESSASAGDKASDGCERNDNALADTHAGMATSTIAIILGSLLSRSRKEAERMKRFRKEDCVIIEQFRDIEDRLNGATLPSHVSSDSMDRHLKLLKETEKSFLDGAFSDPWHVLSDIDGIFNSMIQEYSKDKSTDSTKWVDLVKEIRGDVDGAMRSLGYCCDQTYTLHPLSCCLGHNCSFNPDEEYFSYKNRIICKRCFENASEQDIERDCGPFSPPIKSAKGMFSKLKYETTLEPFIMCIECERRFHQICTMYTRVAYPNGFICDGCLNLKKERRAQDKFRAKALTQCQLAKYLEGRVKSRVHSLGVDKVTILVVRSPKNCTEVDEKILHEFQDMQDKFPAEIKTIFAFQDVGDVDVCFFGMCMQEYDSDCKQPNSARVYISHVETISNSGVDKGLCTAACEEIILSYLEYAKSLGYQWCHIRLNSSDGKDRCLFFRNQNNDGSLDISKVLQVARSKNNLILKDGDVYLKENNCNCTSMIPYFESDLWPSVKNIVKNGNQSTGAGTASNRDLDPQVLSDIYERHKKITVVDLQPASAVSCRHVNDSNTSSLRHLMGSGDNFLSECRKSNWEFSSPRRTRFSSMAFLHKLHVPDPNFCETICNNCGRSVKRYYCCTVCTQLSLCKQCYTNCAHQHKMDEKFSDRSEMVADDSSRAAKVDVPEHFLRCSNDATYTVNDCSKIKDIAMSLEDLNKETTSEDAEQCKQFLRYCFLHAKNCTLAQCSMPLCLTIRKNQKQSLPGATDDDSCRIDADGGCCVSPDVNVEFSSSRSRSPAVASSAHSSSQQTPSFSKGVAAPALTESPGVIDAGVQQAVKDRCVDGPASFASVIRHIEGQRQQQSPSHNTLLSQLPQLQRIDALQSMGELLLGPALPIAKLLTTSAKTTQNASQSANELPMRQQQQLLLPQERLVLTIPPQILLGARTSGSPGGTMRVLVATNHDVPATATQQGQI